VSKRKRPLACQFANNLEEPDTSARVAILEGKYWKRRLESITNEYKKWREISRRQIKASGNEASSIMPNGEYTLVQQSSARHAPASTNEASLLKLASGAASFTSTNEMASTVTSAAAAAASATTINTTAFTMANQPIQSSQPQISVNYMPQSVNSTSATGISPTGNAYNNYMSTSSSVMTGNLNSPGYYDYKSNANSGSYNYATSNYQTATVPYSSGAASNSSNMVGYYDSSSASGFSSSQPSYGTSTNNGFYEYINNNSSNNNGSSGSGPGFASGTYDSAYVAGNNSSYPSAYPSANSSSSGYNCPSGSTLSSSTNRATMTTSTASSGSPTTSFTTMANSSHHYHHPIASKQITYNNRCRSPSPGLFQDLELFNFSSDTLFSTYYFEDPKDPSMS
jgi:hypothetical protein